MAGLSLGMLVRRMCHSAVVTGCVWYRGVHKENGAPGSHQLIWHLRSAALQTGAWNLVTVSMTCLDLTNSNSDSMCNGGCACSLCEHVRHWLQLLQTVKARSRPDMHMCGDLAYHSLTIEPAVWCMYVCHSLHRSLHER